MMRRFVKAVRTPRPTSGLSRRVGSAVLAGLAACVSLATAAGTAEAQEIQITGPLAGAPAVRKLRLHREKRFEIAPGVSFTLLDQYQRTIMPGAALTYHITDWIGVGVWGGFGFQYQTGLADELQEKAVTGRNCAARPSITPCKLTAVNLTHGSLKDDQLGRFQWTVAPQVTVIPFRGKLSLFSALFVDTDVNIFAGPAIVGLQERAPCGADDDKKALIPCSDQKSFQLANRITVAPTFGLGLNFYPSSFIGFGVEWRGIPFSWNTSGFDNHGGGTNEDFPDNNVNGADREFHFNSMLTIHLSLQFPTAIKTTE